MTVAGFLFLLKLVMHGNFFCSEPIFEQVVFLSFS